MKIGAKHILVEQKFEVEDIQKKLESGVSFEQLAKDFSLCGSAKEGGDLGEFSKGMMVKPFEKAVLELEVGQTSEVVPTQFGFHLILRTK
jgi:peptidyl-prolyl cis-trans isomerase C